MNQVTCITSTRIIVRCVYHLLGVVYRSLFSMHYLFYLVADNVLLYPLDLHDGVCVFSIYSYYLLLYIKYIYIFNRRL